MPTIEVDFANTEARILSHLTDKSAQHGLVISPTDHKLGLVGATADTIIMDDLLEAGIY